MNRRLLIQVTTPPVVIGTILLVVCFAVGWYINRMEANLARILSKNVVELKAAQDLEIRVRQLRHHCFLYLIDPSATRLQTIEQDHQHFEDSLAIAQQSATTLEGKACIQDITAGYRQYRDELAHLREEVQARGPRTDYARLSETHPIRHVTDPCHELFRLNEAMMDRTAQESARVSKQVNLLVILLGVVGPISALSVGYNVARGLSRSIYKLSVRVQDMAQHLEQDVGSMSVAVDGDLENLDRQLEHVVGRVEEAAGRLQRQQRQMIRAEQLAAVGQLAASVAHEVRNPLTTVKWLVEASLRSANPRPMTQESLNVIHGAVTRLEKSVQSFLDFARPPVLQRTNCDLRTVLAQSVELIRGRARQQGIAITVQAPEQPVTAKIDQGQFGTVLVNLFLNSLDAMPQEGRLEVNLGLLPGEEVQLMIRDTGPGIPPKILEQPFTPFVSTKATGTGLGLSIARRVVEDHGGTITLGNRPEGGACCTITLPKNHAEDNHAGPAGH